MAESLGVSVLELDGDLTPLGKKMQEAEGLAKKKSTSIGSVFASGLKRAMLPAAAALGALAIGAVKAVDAASDLGEQINKTNVVFRGSEKVMVSWSETTASALGISQRAALEFAGVFGNMLVPMGIARTEAGKMSRGLVELAADMASFNNANPEEVLDALRAGLSGETEPLRRFGVFLNAARIEEEALRMGLIKQGQELDAAGKAQATYSIILKDTGDAQGDFARTSDSLANAQRIMKAEVEDLTAELGMALLPAAQALIGTGLNLVHVIEDNSGAFKVLVAAAGSLAAAIILANGALAIYNSQILIAVKATKGLRLAMAVTPILAVVAAVGFLVEGFLSQKDSADEATGAQDRLTAALRNYNAAVDDANTAREEHTQATFRSEAADIAVIRSRRALNQVEKEGKGGVVALREAQLNYNRSLEEQRIAHREVTKSGEKLRSSQGKQTTETRNQRLAVESLADTYRNRFRQASGTAQRQLTGLQLKTLDITRSTGGAQREVGQYASKLRNAAQAARESNPTLARTAELAADLSEAWGRVVSLPDAKHFLVTARVLTTIEEHRLDTPAHKASGGYMSASGWSWVGERGPELMYLPAGTSVHSNRESMAMAGNGEIVIPVTVEVDGQVLFRAVRRAERDHERRNG